MEQIKVKYIALQNALDRLAESIEVLEYSKYSSDKNYELIRDSVVQRFEFSIDLLWKVLKEYITQEYGILIEFVSPKKIFRESLNVKLINPEEFEEAIKMVDSRNLTSHTYNQDLAESISQKIPGYYNLIRSIVNRLEIS